MKALTKKTSTPTAPEKSDPAPTTLNRYSLPPHETLATLAAMLASPTERPEVTAGRALDLWQSCADVLERTAPHYQFRREIVENVRAVKKAQKAFLSGFDEGKPVPLITFLKACEPNAPLAKDDDRLARWRRYVKAAFEAENLIPGWIRRTPEELERTIDDEIRRSRREGIPYDQLAHHWGQYTEFAKKQKSKSARDRGKHGGRPKKVVK